MQRDGDLGASKANSNVNVYSSREEQARYRAAWPNLCDGTRSYRRGNIAFQNATYFWERLSLYVELTDVNFLRYVFISE